jgi:hypothetical protein
MEKDKKKGKKSINRKSNKNISSPSPRIRKQKKSIKKESVLSSPRVRNRKQKKSVQKVEKIKSAKKRTVKSRKNVSLNKSLGKDPFCVNLRKKYVKCSVAKGSSKCKNEGNEYIRCAIKSGVKMGFLSPEKAKRYLENNKL